jgi:hypothetical protein
MPNPTRWIDALLVAGGTGAAIAGWAEIGVPVAILGVILPLLSWTARRSGRGQNLYRLVPAELVAAHRDLLAAAALPGVTDGPGALRAADDGLLEVAGLLGGRSPRGGAQRRFVAAHVAAMTDAALDLRERHSAWTAARAEVNAISPADITTEPAPGGVLVGLFVIVLFPLFLLWDVVRGAGRGIVSLLDGVALRLRTAGRLAVRAGAAVVGFTVRSFRAWEIARDRVIDSAREARHRVVAARVRLRLRLRRARRIARRA